MFDMFLVGGFGLLAVCLAWGILHGLLETLEHGVLEGLRKMFRIMRRG